MEHKYVEEENIADRYLVGKLSLEEQEEFEKHYLECSKCESLLEEIRFVRDALIMAGSEPVESEFSIKNWFACAIRKLSGTPRTVLAGAASFALAFALLALLFNENRRLDRELEQTRAALSSVSEELRAQKSEQQPDQPGTTMAHSDEGSPPGPEQSSPGQTSGSATGPKVSTPIDLQSNVPVLVLSPLRRLSTASPDPSATVKVEPATRNLVLSLELDGEPRHEIYRASIRGPDGRPRWQAGALKPNRYQSLTLSLNPAILPEGEYVIELEGLPEGGIPVPVSSYSFLIVKNKSKKK
jgi:hypothetical protein